MRTLRRASHASLLERWKGRFTATRRRPRKPFLITTSSVGRPVGRHRRRVVEVHEGPLRLVVDEVRELLGDLLALLDEREHRLLALDGALLAGEAGDVAAGRAVGAARVDEGALAVVRAEVARRLVVVLRRVLEVDGRIDADEGAAALALDDAQGLHRGADGARLAGVRVDEHLAARDALLDVVDLRLDGGQVVLRAALEHELRPERGEARDLHDVLPDVLRQHLRETRRASPPWRSPPSGSSRGRCRGTPRSRRRTWARARPGRRRRRTA